MIVNLNFIASLCIISLPFLLITGPFLSDLCVIIVDIIFIYLLIKNKDFSILKNNFFKFLLLFNLYITLRSFFSEDFLLSFKSAFPYIRFIIFCFAVLYFLEKKKNLLNNFSKSLILSTLILCFDAVIQYIFGFNTLGFAIDNPDKLNGLFGSEAVLGSYLVRLLPLTIVSYLILFNHKSNKIPFFILLLLISTVIFLSGSRTSLALMLLFYVLYFCLFKNIRKSIFIGFSVLVILVVIASPFNKKLSHSIYYNIQDPIRTIFNEDEESLRSNVKDKKIIIFTQVYHTHYETAFKMFNKNKLFGVGNKMYRKLCNEDEYFVNEFSCTTHPHNFYLQVLAENGLFGFIFLILIFFYVTFLILKEFWLRNIRNKKLSGDYALIILIGIFINLWPIAPSGNIFNNWLSILIYLPVGFYLYCVKLKK